jgi:hypothetical protein
LSLLRQMREIPGIVDARMQQSSDYPQLDFQADRSRMAQYGLTEHDAARYRPRCCCCAQLMTSTRTDSPTAPVCSVAIICGTTSPS